MANEIELSVSFDYEKNDSTFVRTLSALLANVAGSRFINHSQTIGTAEEAIDLGELANLGWAIFINRDATNYVELRSATGAGNDILRIPAGKFAVFHFGSDVTAPFAIANIAACQLEYFIAEV